MNKSTTFSTRLLYTNDNTPSDLLIREIFINETDERIPLIQDENAKRSIPREALLSCAGEREQIRVASLLFRNMSGFLPDRLEGHVGRFVQFKSMKTYVRKDTRSVNLNIRDHDQNQSNTCTTNVIEKACLDSLSSQT